MHLSRSTAGLGLLMVAAWLGNQFHAPLFFGVDFLFGSIASLVALYLFGLSAGVLTAAVSGAYTVLVWFHPYAAVILILEALAVGLLMRRRIANLVLLDALFWLILGMPLVWLFYSGPLHTELLGTVVVMFKQAVNGIFNALIASLLVTYTPLRQWAGLPGPRTIPLRQTLFNLLVSLVLFPALILMLVDSRQQVATIERAIHFQLTATSVELGSRLESWEQHRLRAVTALAEVAQRSGLSSPLVQQSVTAVHRAVPGFHNLYVADAQGTTVAFDPPKNAAGIPMVGQNFADRDYYRRLKTARRPVVTDVFAGRGGVFVPIVTLGAPILRNGQFAGYALGAIDLSGFAEILRPYVQVSKLRATVVDSKGQVIASTWPGRPPMSPFAPYRGGERRYLDEQTFQWLPEMRGATPMARWREGLYVRETPVRGAAWKLILEAPIAPHQERLQQRYAASFCLLLIVSILALLVAAVLARWLTAPLLRLAQTTTGLPSRLTAGVSVTWPNTRVTEVATLIGNFQGMLQALEQHFGALRTANEALARHGAEMAEQNQALHREIQERERAETALTLSENRYRTVVEQSPIAIQVFAPEGSVLQANQAWQRLWQSTPEQWAGYNLLQDEQLRASGLLPQLRRAFRGEVVVLPATQYDPSQSGRSGRIRWVEAFLYPVKEPGGTIREVVLMLQDVTERRQVEEERARLLELEQTARARAEQHYREAQEAARRKDEFLAMLAHELRNPLGAVSNALHVLRTAGTDSPAGMRALEVLARQVHHQSRLVDDLLDVSRIQRGKIVLREGLLDLTRLVRDTAEDYRDSTESAGLTLEIALPPDPLWVEGDPTRLAQVLGNLLHNAVKFTNPGGRVSVRLTPDFESHRAEIYVRDTGIGIAPEMLPQVFETFSQADRSLDRSRGGLGLGLALVRGLVELHGGEVCAHSEGAGTGAEFVVILPLASAVPVGETAQPVAVTTSSSKRILVVEDNRDAAETLRDLLELAEHEVFLAHTGPAGIAAARELRPEVVLCDIGLPGMDGLAVARELRADPALAKTRLIAISGYGQADDRRQSLEAGFELHLTKPIDPDELQQVLDREVDGHS